MTKSEFLNELDDILELDPGTLTGEESLKSLEGWDSLSTLSFIAMADEKLGATVSAAEVAKAATVSDLMAMFGDKVSG